MRSLVVYALAGIAIGAGLVVVVLCQPAMLLTLFSLPLYLIHLTAVAGGFAAGDVQELANSADKDGKTLLHLATARGYELMDKWLLTNGAIKSVNSADKDGKTPLYLATAGGYESIMELLFRNRAMKSVNLADKDGKTPLYMATAGENESIVKLLLRNGARRAVNMADKDGKTPLYLATAGGYESIVKLLLKKGARKSVNLVDKDGKTLLHLATTEGYEPIKELLLQNGAKPSNHLIDRNGRDSPHLESEDHDDSSTDIQPGEVKKGGNSVSQTCYIGTLFWPSRLPKGITRIYWQRHCGYGSYDDYASRHHAIFAIQEKLKTSGLKVTISSQKLSLLSEFSMAARNIILGVFRRYSSSETSNSQINQRTPHASEHGGPSQGSTTCDELDITDGKNTSFAIDKAISVL
ncbi:unnamed protein product [Clonostachys rhizophaga]|uniref:Uncharacterized protein n=1 Tax=Clonostachys rhizophaga TaxID=160324 RepID=A0A9N9VCU6_9HYPO|nr:unnamed protein product [Clonostachys rhizophaga]